MMTHALFLYLLLRVWIPVCWTHMLYCSNLCFKTVLYNKVSYSFLSISDKMICRLLSNLTNMNNTKGCSDNVKQYASYFQLYWIHCFICIKNHPSPHYIPVILSYNMFLMSALPSFKPLVLQWEPNVNVLISQILRFYDCLWTKCLTVDILCCNNITLKGQVLLY